MAGAFQSCALLEDRTVACWGGKGTSTPRRVEGLTDVTDIAVMSGVVALRADGRIVVAGQPGPPRTLGLTGVTRVSGNPHSLCAIVAEGHVTCYSGGPFDWSTGAEREGVPVRGLRGATELSSGYHHVCALLADGTVSCWLVFGEEPLQDFAAFPVSGVQDVVGLSVGSSTLCVRRREGSAACFELAPAPEKFHEIGRVDALSMLQEDDGAPLVCLARGAEIECQRLDDLGSGYAIPAITVGPVPKSELGPVVEFGLSSHAACALDRRGRIACWGHNLGGRLGHPEVGYVEQAELVPGVPRATEVAAGNRFSCALTVDGEVYCWGKTNPASPQHPEPSIERVPGLDGVRRLFASRGYACAETASGEVQCFFGVKWRDSERVPMRVAVLEKARAAVLPDMGVLSWAAAASDQGELLVGKTPGFDTLMGLSLSPVSGVRDVRELAGAYSDLMVLDAQGHLFRGRVHDGKLYGKLTPVPSLDGALDVSHRLVLLPGGELRTWSDAPDQSTLVRDRSPLVSLLDGPSPCGRTRSGDVVCLGAREDEVIFRAMKSSSGAGERHICGVDAQGRVFCWGENGAGQCGVRVGVERSEIPLIVPLP